MYICKCMDLFSMYKILTSRDPLLQILYKNKRILKKKEKRIGDPVVLSCL